MLKKIYAGVVILIAIMLQSCATTPADYAQEVMDITSKVEKQTSKISDALGKRNIQVAKAAIAECQKESEKALARLNQLGPYDEKSSLGQDKEFIDAAIDFVEFYNGLLKNEYQESISILEKGGNFTPEDVDKLQFTKLGISNEYKLVYNELIRTFKLFCKNYDLRLAE